MIERGMFGILDAENISTKVIHFSSPESQRWAGVVVLGAGDSLTLASESRYDLFVLSGTLESDGVEPMHSGAFASRCEPAVFKAREQGATAFVYRESSPEHCRTITQVLTDRVWHKAKAAGMYVAPLSDSGHSLSLVKWEPGARTREHDHPYGEEIFVLSGELRSHDERYPAGTWLRLHPGSQHEPFADVATVIILRNGHLRPQAD
ncbi:MAG: cupin domain-containing protein [Pseudomonas sp.]